MEAAFRLLNSILSSLNVIMELVPIRKLLINSDKLDGLPQCERSNFEHPHGRLRVLTRSINGTVNEVTTLSVCNLEFLRQFVPFDRVVPEKSGS